MEPVGDQRDRAEQPAADDFDQHHDRAERDHRPGLPFAGLVPLAEKNMAVERSVGVVDRSSHFR